MRREKGRGEKEEKRKKYGKRKKNEIETVLFSKPKIFAA